MLQVAEDIVSGEAPFDQETVGEHIVRDTTYYMQDGSCVLQVENTLFNVCLAVVACLIRAC